MKATTDFDLRGCSALELNPNQVKVYLMRSQAYRELGNFEASLADLKLAAAVHERLAPSPTTVLGDTANLNSTGTLSSLFGDTQRSLTLSQTGRLATPALNLAASAGSTATRSQLSLALTSKSDSGAVAAAVAVAGGSTARSLVPSTARPLAHSLLAESKAQHEQVSAWFAPA